MFAYLNEEQLTQLLVCLGDSPKTQNAYDLAVLATETGARRGELAGLRSSDVDWKHMTVLIRDVKRSTRRLLPITSAVYCILDRRHKAANGEDAVFGNTSRMMLSAAARLISVAARSCGLGHVTFKILRHTAIYRLTLSKAQAATNPRTTHRP